MKYVWERLRQINTSLLLLFLSFLSFCIFFKDTHVWYTALCSVIRHGLLWGHSFCLLHLFFWISFKQTLVHIAEKNTKPLEMSMNSRSSLLAFSTYSSHVETPFTCQWWMAVYGMNLLLCRHEDNRCCKEWCEPFTCAWKFRTFYLTSGKLVCTYIFFFPVAFLCPFPYYRFCYLPWPLVTFI